MRNRRRRFVNHGFVEAGTSPPGLIDQIGGNALAYEIWIPAFPPVRSGLETCGRVTGTMDHDDRWRVAFPVHRYLELDVHLANHDLIGSRSLVGSVRRGDRRVAGDLRDAADKEAPLIFDHQWPGQELLHL